MAAQDAADAGIDPAAVEALMQQPIQIGPVTFQPVSMQTLLALQLLVKRRSALGAAASPLSSGGHDGNNASTADADEDVFALAEAVLVFAKPLESARLLKASLNPDVWEDHVIKFMGSLLPPHLQAMGALINEQMQLLKQLGGDATDATSSPPQQGQATG